MHSECYEKGAFAIHNQSQVDCVKRVVARMPKFDPAKRELFGKYYDPKKYLESRLKDISWGNVVESFRTLQRIPAPEYWPHPEAKRPNLPPLNLDKHFSRWIKAEDYFKALCKHEAGEFINRVVEGVEGVYQIRPRPNSSDDALTDPYVLEDPYGYTRMEGAGSAVHAFVAFRPDGFKYMEAPSAAYLGTWAKRWSQYEYSRLANEPTQAFVRQRAHPERATGVVHDQISQLASRYGYTWRETTGIRERDMGVAGGDVIVVDLQTGEVLGYRRGFSRSVITDRTLGGRNWNSTENCPSYKIHNGSTTKNAEIASEFVRRILRP